MCGHTPIAAAKFFKTTRRTSPRTSSSLSSPLPRTDVYPHRSSLSSMTLLEPSHIPAWHLAVHVGSRDAQPERSRLRVASTTVVLAPSPRTLHVSSSSPSHRSPLASPPITPPLDDDVRRRQGRLHLMRIPNGTSTQMESVGIEDIPLKSYNFHILLPNEKLRYGTEVLRERTNLTSTAALLTR